MSRRRIAILGGGIGGLTTAYHLSRTPELRDVKDKKYWEPLRAPVP